jgi:hypothetical protein
VRFDWNKKAKTCRNSSGLLSSSFLLPLDPSRGRGSLVLFLFLLLVLLVGGEIYLILITSGRWAALTRRSTKS